MSSWSYNDTIYWSALALCDISGCTANVTYSFTLLNTTVINITDVTDNGSTIFPSQYELHDFGAKIFSEDGLPVNITFSTNITGSWVFVDWSNYTQESILKTVTYNITNYTAYNTVHYWGLNVSCNGIYRNESFNFTTYRSNQTVSGMVIPSGSYGPYDNEENLDPDPSFYYSMVTNPMSIIDVDQNVSDHEQIHYEFYTNSSGSWQMLYQNNITNASTKILFDDGDYLLSNPFDTPLQWYYINFTSIRVNKTTDDVWPGAEWYNFSYRFSLTPIFSNFTIEVKDYDTRVYWINWTGFSIGPFFLNWEFGDGASNYNNEHNVIHRYKSGGPFTINCTAEVVASGVRTSSEQTVTCNPLPEEEARLSNPLVGIDWGGLFFGPIVLLIIITLVMSTYMLIQGTTRDIKGVLNPNAWKRKKR